VLPPDVGDCTTLPEVQSDNDPDKNHEGSVRFCYPNLRMPCLRWHSSARGRSCWSDEIAGNRGLAQERIASAHV